MFMLAYYIASRTRIAFAQIRVIVFDSKLRASDPSRPYPDLSKAIPGTL